MKETFPEWYSPDDFELRHIATTATVALDASVLLDLHRADAEQRAEILSVLSTVADRLVVPYQAAMEYQRNRLKVL